MHWRLAVLALGLGIAGCASVVASAPPTRYADHSEAITVLGHRATVAAKAARSLVSYSYLTKRFGADSLWGTRGQENFAARIRFAPFGDSTRVGLELWSSCQPKPVCVRAEAVVLLERIASPEAPPM